MTNSPMFSKMAADRILRRAAEIEGSEESGPVTVDELRSIAGLAVAAPAPRRDAIDQISSVSQIS